MSKLGIIRLKGIVGDGDLGLFTFDQTQHTPQEAANIVENAVEAAYQLEEAGNLGEGWTVLDKAEDTLATFNIARVETVEATTDRL